MQLKYRKDIDGLRALAVLAVIAFHAAPNSVPGGYVGVDVFFVISGFLISSIIVGDVADGRFSIVEFYAHRVRRIFPALIVVMSTTLLLARWVMIDPSEYEILGRHVVGGAAFVSNLLLWSESGYFDIASDRKPLLHLWSLGIEEQFYLVWPIFLVTIWKWPRMRVPALVFVSIVSFAVNICLLGSPRPSSFFLPASRFWELTIGATLAVVTATTSVTVRKSSVAIAYGQRFGPSVGLALILAADLLFSKQSNFPGWLALIPVLGTLMILAGSPTTWVSKLLASGVPSYIGRISYPLYLWHWPLLSLLHVVEIEDLAQKRAWKAVVLGVSFVLAAITHHYLELPSRRIPVRRVATYAIGGMLLIAMAGLAVSFRARDFDRTTFLANGSFYRMPHSSISQMDQIATNLAEEKSAYPKAYRTGYCLLELGSSEAGNFSPECIAREPKIALWGDSYAAHLAFGLRATVDRAQDTFSQLTISGCVPILGFDVPAPPASQALCRRLNAEIADIIAGQNPHTLLVAGNWMARAGDSGFSSRLEETLSKAKHWAKDVILVGPPVEFGTSQARVAQLNVGHSEAPNSNQDALRSVDQLLRDIAKRSGIMYVSPSEMFCEQARCLVTINVCGKERLLSWDSGHLTRDGSIYYARRLLMPAILAKTSHGAVVGNDFDCKTQ